MIIIAFLVKVTERLVRVVSIDAATSDEAIEIAKQRYRNEEIVLTADDFADVKFTSKQERTKTNAK